MNKIIRMMTAAAVAVSLVTAVPAVQAQAMTRTQVDSEIKKLNTQIKKYRGQYKSAQKKDDSTRALHTTIEGTRYTSDPDPIIVYDRYNDRYFHLPTLDGLTLTQDGRFTKVTGQLKADFKKTFEWKNIRCIEAVPAEAPHAVSDLDKKVNKAQKRLGLLKKAKKETMTFNNAPYTLSPGDQVDISYALKYDTGSVNKITWTSTSKKVAVVSKNGTVTALKTGSTVIKAKLSVTGKTYQCRVVVTAK